MEMRELVAQDIKKGRKGAKRHETRREKNLNNTAPDRCKIGRIGKGAGGASRGEDGKQEKDGVAFAGHDCSCPGVLKEKKEKAR